MNNRNAFFNTHPVALLVFFAAVFIFSMFVRNVCFAVISLLGALLYIALTNKVKRFLEKLLLCIIIIFISGLTNPLFSHNGVTVLFYLNDMAFTFESLFYGICAGTMISSVLMWSLIFSECFDSAKTCYIIGNSFGNTAVTISVSLRLIDLLKQKNEELKAVRCSEHGITGALSRYLILLGWSLEHGIELGHSMKAKNYGKCKRTHYNRYRFNISDIALICASLISGCVIICLNKSLDFDIYPRINYSFDFMTVICITAFGILLIIPSAVEVWNRLLWKYYR